MASASWRWSGTAFPNFSAVLCLFWLFSSTALAASAVIGIDFGTEYLTAALVKPGIPLDIVLTKDARRKEASAVTFKPIKNAPEGSYPERLYGSDAVALSARFSGNCYPNLKAILGLPVDDPRVIEYSARYPALFIEPEKTKGTAAFISGAFTTEQDAWMVEELLAMEFQSIQKNAEALAGKGTSIRNVVITIPPYFDMEERRAIELAADMAGLRVLSLISDGLAVGLHYATSRTFPSITDGKKPEHHMVFDMGAGSTKATIMKFQSRLLKEGKKFNKTIQEVEVLGAGWDRTLGGDAFNALIVGDMVSKFTESKNAKAASISSESVRTNGRATAMLWMQAEKLRQVLSANSEGQTSFEGLYDDIDFRYKLTRADFEQLSSSHASRVSGVVKMALERAGLELSDIDSIILNGGATRTPFVQKELGILVGTSGKLRSNVNADEAAALGAAFKGAQLSSGFRVKDIKTHDAAGYAVGMEWTNINLKPQKQRLYTPQSHLGVEEVVSFQNLEDFDVHFYQQVDTAGDGVFSGEREVARLVTKNLTATVTELKEKRGCDVGDIITRFGVRLNAFSGEVEVTKAAAQCEVDDDGKVGGVVDGVKGLFGFGSKKSDQDVFQDSDIVSDAEASAESSTATTSSTTASSSSSSASDPASSSEDEDKPRTKRLVAIPLDFTVEKKGYLSLPAEVLFEKKERLVAFDDSDHVRKMRDEALNQLEGYTYRVRDMLEDDAFIEVSVEDERNPLRDLAETIGDWLYGEGTGASREVLKAKLGELKALVKPIERRKDELAKRPEQMKSFQVVLDDSKAIVALVMSKIKAQEESLLAESLSSASSTSTASSETPTETDGTEEGNVPVETAEEPPKEDSPPMPPTSFKQEDLDVFIAHYKELSDWYTTKKTEQETLKITDDPVLLVKDMIKKAEEINQAGTDLFMKGMKRPEKPKSKTSRTKKPKTSKTKKSKTTKQTDSSATTTDAAEGTGNAEFQEQPTDEEVREEVKNKDEETHKKDEL